MIRKFARLDAPPEVVTAMFHDLEQWPAWMAGIRSVQILDRSEQPRYQETICTADVVQVQAGRTLRQRLECRLGPRSLVQRQLQGRFRRWDASWRFLDPPEGTGTTITLELEIELGLLGAVIPSRMVQAIIDDIFVATVRTARRHCRTLPGPAERTGPPGQAAASCSEESLLEVLAYPDHLEIRIAGRRYRLEAIEPGVE